MNEPKIAAKEPTSARLEPGKTYAWCQCGESKAQPFCDGSHQGTEYRPVLLKVEDAREAWLCMCKRTKTPPYCDGSHKTL